MSPTTRVRNTLLSAALATALAVPLIQSAQAAAPAAPATLSAPGSNSGSGSAANAVHGPTGDGGHGASSTTLPGPQGAPGSENLQPTTDAAPQAGDPAGTTAVDTGEAAGGCSLDAFTSLTPAALADFLADRSHSYQGCLRPLLVDWDPKLAKIFTPAHVRAAAQRVSALAPRFDGANNLNQQELWYYLHIAVYFDYGHPELDLNDDTTTAAIEQAIADYTANPRVFEPTTANGSAMGELLQTSTAPNLRPGRLALGERVLRMFAPGSAAIGDTGWNWAVQAALQISFQGVNNRSEDPEGRFLTALAANPGFREAVRAYSGYAHLKGTRSEWAVDDAMKEYARFATVEALKPELRGTVGPALASVQNIFGRLGIAWGALAVPVNDLGLCGQYAGTCRADVDREIFPHTYSYDNGTLVVRTALDRATADQLYYATKQVKAQFFRVLGTDQPLAGDDHPVLNVRLFDTKPHYRALQYLLHGIGDVENGGMFMEGSSTFYTYQRTTQESYLSLEELFRHEYTHYLNARWAIPESGYTTRWPADATFAMNEGTAEYFAGATAKDGVKVRLNMLRPIADNQKYGVPHLTVDQTVHATWNGLGFRAYPYAAVLFNLLGERHPEQLAEMYRLLRADDLDGFNAWRDRLGRDAALQGEYAAYLAAQIPQYEKLYVPNTQYTSNGNLDYAWASEVQGAFARATGNNPVCKDNGDWNSKMRFSCSGRITANLTNTADAGQVRKDMSATVDYFLLTRAGAAADNLADMNCWFGKVEVWPTGAAGTADYTCEGPLRR
ncbi:collagenase [Kitasatospora sp. NPDC004240]